MTVRVDDVTGLIVSPDAEQASTPLIEIVAVPADVSIVTAKFTHSSEDQE